MEKAINYAKKHKYPSYHEVSNILENQLPSHLKNNSIKWFSEYSINNHERCKNIYESGMDANIVKSAGIKINKEGGMTAMLGVFYVFFYINPWRYSNDNDLIFLYKEIEILWDGIGQWKK